MSCLYYLAVFPHTIIFSTGTLAKATVSLLATTFFTGSYFSFMISSVRCWVLGRLSGTLDYQLIFSDCPES